MDGRVDGKVLGNSLTKSFDGAAVSVGPSDAVTVGLAEGDVDRYDVGFVLASTVGELDAVIAGDVVGLDESSTVGTAETSNVGDSDAL